MTELNIIAECYVDTKVAEIVGQSKKYNHQHGCGDIAKILQGKLQNTVCLGIVDEDKYKGEKPKYFSDFKVIIEEHNLILKKHVNREHYLILICPEMEEWLLNDAKVADILLEKFDLPDKLKGFKKLSKNQDIDRNNGFYLFIKALLDKKAPSITKLKHWIELFKSEQFKTL